jgi:hypothetical protein
MDLDSWDKPKIVIKKEDESTNTDTTMSNDSELYAYLPPNSMFEIYANIMAYSGSQIPDIKIDWSTSGITLLSYRMSTGPGVSITSGLDSESVAFGGYNDLSIDKVFGLAAGASVTLKENFIIKTGINGGLINLRWAQNTSSANNITVRAGSYLKITKVEQLQRN